MILGSILQSAIQIHTEKTIPMTHDISFKF